MLFITPRCTMIPLLLLLTLAHVPCVSSTWAAVHSDAGHDVAATSQGINNTDPLGVTEQLGNLVAVDAVFRDEDGTPIRIGDILTVPTLLLPVYYGCPNVCSLLQANIAQLLPRVDLKPGKEYQVISLSFDDTETPAMARQARKDYLSAAGENWPPMAWRFLTGDGTNIRRMMGSVGFHFQRNQDQFVHPVVMVVLSAGGQDCALPVWLQAPSLRHHHGHDRGERGSHGSLHQTGTRLLFQLRPPRQALRAEHPPGYRGCSRGSCHRPVSRTHLRRTQEKKGKRIGTR